MCLRFLTDYGESRHWPEISEISASHIEEYLVYIQERPRWVGKSDQRPVSASSVETHYRRIKTFFNWLVERGYLATNPLNLIQHPRIEERVIPTVSDHQILDLLELVDPRHARTTAKRFRALRNRAIIWLLVDTPIQRGELAGLSVDDVDLDAGIIKVMGKGRRVRWSPKFGQVVKSGFCSYNEYGIGGEHETEPKKTHPIVQSQGSSGSIKG